MQLNARDKILRAKIQLQTTKPFFSYLIMYLKCIEANDRTPTMAVDVKGNLYYNTKWVDKLSEEKVEAVLCHESMHIVLQHLERLGTREHELFNMANDLIVNDILVAENMSLPEGLVPNYDHKFTFPDGLEITDLNIKLSEQVYEELYKHYKKNGKKGSQGNGQSQQGKGQGNGQSGSGQGSQQSSSGKGFDQHIYGEENGNGKKGEKDGKGNTVKVSKAEMEELKKKWREVLSGASTYAKQRGLLPKGMERLVDDLLESKVSWRHKLMRFITNEQIHDFTYSRPHKKSISTGVYMPSLLREQIEIVTHIDTSGSISQKEMTEFLSEICSIARSFHNIKIDLLVGDSQLQNHYEITNGTISDIMNMEFKGGGGTSHNFVKSWLEEHKPNARCLITLTDGWSDIERVFPEIPDKTHKLIVLCENGVAEDKLSEYGETIKLR